ncbi:serine hydrolase [uncultured Brevundimonas sp.]|uniref:serine hydrolase domain-containing protein n=1 Tax=uncultured Brevundimonas sp. TaxID=213418 RepID=UPI00260BDD61|nr:serine hydrolase [uncultured Brevundimonas sp.]
MRLHALSLAMLGAMVSTGACAQTQWDDEAVYLRRFQDNLGAPRDSYDTLEAVPGVNSRLPVRESATISTSALDAAEAYAAANNSQAFLVWKDGALERASYFNGADADTGIISRSMAKPLSSLAIGRAIALGKITSLDQPVADFIPEWKGSKREGILVRHLLDMTAGFLAQNQSSEPSNIWSRTYLHPRHDEIIVAEYPLTHAPGTSYNYNNATADLVAVVIERATGVRYGDFVSTEVLKPIEAKGGDIWVNRPGGTAHSGCCILLPAESWMRMAILIHQDGVWEGQRLLPEGYVSQMRTPTKANPYYGLGLWIGGEYTERRGFGGPNVPGGVLHSQPYKAKDIYLFDGNSNQVVYVMPEENTIVLRMGGTPPRSPEWDNSILPNLIYDGLSQ